MPTVSELISQNIANVITNSQTWGGILKNVASYGAVGDGATDDTVAIQAAIDAAVDAGGKCVFFPHGSTGVYKVTALTDLASVVLLGDNASFSGISNVIHQLGEVGTDEIVTAMILDSAITTAKINDLAVTSAKLGADAVTSAKIANAVVIGKVLTGYVSGAGTVAATDTILQAIQKLNGNAAEHLADTTPHATIQGVETLGFKDATNLTIATGEITITQSNHVILNESGASTDDLDTINGGAKSDFLIIRAGSSAQDVVIKHGTGNIFTFDGSDITLSSSDSALILFKSSATTWTVIGIQGAKRSGDNFTGKVGFNTASPQAKAHITGSSGAVTGATYRPNAPIIFENNNSIEIQIITPNANDGQLRFGDGDSNFAGALTYSHSIDAMLFYTDAAERLRITSDGTLQFNISGTTHGECTGSPEGAVTAVVGSTRYRTDGGASTTLYVKESGTGNTGWVAK